MSDDDDDDRMERARRIRQMREGRRDASEAEATDTAETDDTDSEVAAPGDVQQADTDTERPASTTDGGATIDDDTEAASSDADGAEDDSADAEDGSAVNVEPADDESEWFDDGDGSDEADGDTPAESSADAADDGQSAAAKAAQAATQFETVESAGEPDTSLEELEADAESVPDDGPEPTIEDDDGTEDEPETAASQSTSDEEEIRVLEFELGDERYCLNIMYVEEIVKKDHITRVPNTPSFVQGVVDLRGQITTILDPKDSIGIEDEGTEELIIVFDGETFEDQGHIGWLVDEVRQVTPITPSEVKESPTDRKDVNGIIEREDEFVIWTTPEIALAQAETDDEE